MSDLFYKLGLSTLVFCACFVFLCIPIAATIGTGSKWFLLLLIPAVAVIAVFASMTWDMWTW